ncbi:type II inositol 3,4-bisphosphate 4-phosphatase-like [Periophthalmus magnuspinnatus]|uniref:type II inositol 3,4-bisphosphate 4-phosphatase-like n=1 Tax=Periophthalmus magnuspinnatus TaxID=409849 RepID=UPI0024364D58|nr:type II inositol 3,4-bisphosphate 4-phosphatase-like [Periophthalmus magnuspinnatus]
MSSGVTQTYNRTEKKYFALWDFDVEVHSSRPVDGVSEVGEVKVSEVQMEAETDDKTTSDTKSLCDFLHGSVHDKEHSALMRAVLCCSVGKVYRFPTQDKGWLLVQEKMSETPLSFSLPRQLLSMLSVEYRNRAQEVMDLRDLSPHLEERRSDIISRCDHMTRCYQETLQQLDTVSASCSFKASSSKSERHLQFVPTNLHCQRMEVTSPDTTGVWYDVTTFGAPADHHQGFKQGGLRRLMSRVDMNGPVSYSREERSRARGLLEEVARLQPLIFGQAEELLALSLEVNTARLQKVLDALAKRTEEFVHALKDELVNGALLAEHRQTAARRLYTCNGNLPGNTSANQERRVSEGQLEVNRAELDYDEEEWDTVWANVGKSLNCIIALVDRLKEKQGSPKPPDPRDSNPHNKRAPSSSSSPSSSLSWQEQLLPLVVTLRDCVREAVSKARAAMTFVLLQGAAADTVGQGSEQLVQRQHGVFSQTLTAVTSAFILKLHNSLDDANFLKQLHTIGILAQFEGLLSTYGDELGMLEDMEMGVSELSKVKFVLTEGKSDQSDDLLPTLTGTWDSLVVNVPLPPENFSSLPQELREGHLIHLHPVFFNIGINQQQSLAERFGDSSLQEILNQESCERLRVYCTELHDKLNQTADMDTLPELLSALDSCVEAKKRKNVEVLWLAATVCRKVNGLRLTSCKSAKDRTSMSVTLEQCALLRERHGLHPQHFSAALDAMRSDGCRLENVQKNIGCRRFAFTSVQLLAFPKHYRPPDGTYGHAQT